MTAFILIHLNPEEGQGVKKRIYGPQGTEKAAKSPVKHKAEYHAEDKQQELPGKISPQPLS